MKTSKINSVKIQVANGIERILLAVEPTTETPKGIIALGGTALANAGLLKDSAIIVKKAVEHSIALGQAYVTYDLRMNKEGEAWVDKKSGRAGNYRVNWYQPVNISLQISSASITQSRLQNSNIQEAIYAKGTFAELMQLAGMNMPTAYVAPIAIAPVKEEIVATEEEIAALLGEPALPAFADAPIIDDAATN